MDPQKHLQRELEYWAMRTRTPSGIAPQIIAAHPVGVDCFEGRVIVMSGLRRKIAYVFRYERPPGDTAWVMRQSQELVDM